MHPNRGHDAHTEPDRVETSLTLRRTVPELEAKMDYDLRVLDQGFIRVIDYMGSDAAIVEAARVSYGRGTRKLSDDRALIRYLMRHRHTTPFEMCEIKFHVKLPIFVARQWIRHRMANVNEYSARYSILNKEFYVPDKEYLEARRIEQRTQLPLGGTQSELFPPMPRHVAVQSATNRQGRGDILPEQEAAQALDWIKAETTRAYGTYMKLLNEDSRGAVADTTRRGIARELARMVLPTNIYTQWYWKTDLHNLFHFIELRADVHAQYEIRAYAERMLEVVAVWVPIAHQAFLDYRMNAATFSAPMLDVLRRMLAGESVDEKESGLSKREFAELVAALGKGG